eukprot:1195663-Prorocentrum_minimum.AAC.6
MSSGPVCRADLVVEADAAAQVGVLHLVPLLSADGHPVQQPHLGQPPHHQLPTGRAPPHPAAAPVAAAAPPAPYGAGITLESLSRQRKYRARRDAKVNKSTRRVSRLRNSVCTVSTWLQAAGEGGPGGECTCSLAAQQWGRGRTAVPGRRGPRGPGGNSAAPAAAACRTTRLKSSQHPCRRTQHSRVRCSRVQCPAWRGASGSYSGVRGELRLRCPGWSVRGVVKQL